MGLDFDGADAHWSYSGFFRFRQRLGAVIGITNLDNMEHFGGQISFTKYDDPIVILIDHSDCDGSLTIAECQKIAPRLREIVAPWPDNDYDKAQAIKLADGMEKCAKKKKALRFC